MALSTTVAFGGGFVGAGDNNMVTGSIPANDLVIVILYTRSPDSPELSLSPALTGQTLQLTTSADFNGGVTVVYTGTMTSTGALTVTPLQTSNDRWYALVFRGSNLAYLDSDGAPQGVFNASPSFGPSSAMSAAGGVAIGAIMVGAGDEYTITRPTSAPTANEPQSGFRLSCSYGTELRTSGQTTTVTGTQSVADVGVLTAVWVLLEDTGGGATRRVVANRRSRGALINAGWY